MFDYWYKQLVLRVIEEGEQTPDRTGTGTRSVFGATVRVRPEEGFPLLTLKSTNFHAIKHELLWFLKGYTSLQYLHDNGVHIWDEWADMLGDLGPIYGAQWRGDGKTPDQISALVHGLKTDPHSRRHVVSAWRPEVLPQADVPPNQQVRLGKQALAPCHTIFQCRVGSRNQLDLAVYQRSADVFLGLPFNVASYSLLQRMIAYHCGLEVGDLVWNGGDVHLYDNHLVQAAEMLDRAPTSTPTVQLDYRKDLALWEVEGDQILLTSYSPNAPIKAPVAV